MIRLIGLLFLLTLAACAETGSGSISSMTDDSRVVTGTVTYRERIALPPETIVQIQLLDVSLMDVSAKLITEQTLTLPHQVPIPFELVYRPLDIDERMTYAVRATISNGDKLLFVTDRSYPVLTRGKPEQVDLVLVRP
jgi:putative lipoprotein